jgi:hypothetical protein
MPILISDLQAFEINIVCARCYLEAAFGAFPYARGNTAKLQRSTGWATALFVERTVYFAIPLADGCSKLDTLAL